MNTNPFFTRLALALGLISLGVSCSGRIDAYTQKRVLPAGLTQPDLRQVCALGESFRHAIASFEKKNGPYKALVIAETASAMCFEPIAWEIELDQVRAKKNLKAIGTSRSAEMMDARIAAQRVHAKAARRFWQGWLRSQQAFGSFGGVDEPCPRIKKGDEFVFLLGQFAGLNAVLHDRASGGMLGLPLDTLPQISRSARCIPNERWWGVPASFEAAAWAVIPGSGPKDIDPWEQLNEAAILGESQGMRLSRALLVLLAANADQTDRVVASITDHSESLAHTEGLPEALVFDRYAFLVSQHQADLIWTRETGHRSPEFGLFPQKEGNKEETPPLFTGDDPFGSADPFGP